MNESLVFLLPVLLFSVIVHEYAHGYVAEWWGDPTARMLGRLTLNPVPHIDLFGSILVPLFLLVTGSSILFGWAKPVPVTLENFRDRKWGDITVSLAGPASNVLLAVAFAAGLFVARVVTGGEVAPAILLLCHYGVFINLILAVFNMLPVPPLDGSHVVANFLSPPMAYSYRSAGRYGLIIVILLLVFTPVGSIVFGVTWMWTSYMVNLALGIG
jgi:Zn-dependent protease